jgi:hypothetical protein
MARDELGIDPEELGGSAWTAAIASFLLFTVGALVPVLPFVFVEGDLAIGLRVAGQRPSAARHRRRDHASHGPERLALGCAPTRDRPWRGRGDLRGWLSRQRGGLVIGGLT